MVSDADIKTIKVPVLLWAKVIRDLRRRGKGVRESGAFLLGRLDNSQPRVTSYVCYDDIDPDAYQLGAIAFHASGCAALLAALPRPRSAVAHRRPHASRPRRQAEPHRCPSSNVALAGSYRDDCSQLCEHDTVVSKVGNSAFTSIWVASSGARIRRLQSNPARKIVNLVGKDMGAFDSEISRISKLLIDNDQADADAVLARRQAYTVMLSCGDDVASSYTLQLAVLTASAIAMYCFPGAVRTAISPTLADAPLLRRHLAVAPIATFDQAVITARSWGHARLGIGEVSSPLRAGCNLGNAPMAKGALRVTFDGWIAKVGPLSAAPGSPSSRIFLGRRDTGGFVGAVRAVYFLRGDKP